MYLCYHFQREGYMALLNSDKILKLMPKILNKELSSDGKTIFKALEKILIYDECFIYFTNPESLQLKYLYKKHNNYVPDTYFKINNTIKNLIFSNESKILDDNSELIKTVKLQRQQTKIISTLKNFY